MMPSYKEVLGFSLIYKKKEKIRVGWVIVGLPRSFTRTISEGNKTTNFL
jgi:hypothetical protein